MNPNQDYKDDSHSDVSPSGILVVVGNSDVSNEDVELVDNWNSEISVLEKKIDRINDMLLEQQNIVKSLIDCSVIYKSSVNLQTKVSGSEETMSCSSQRNNSDIFLLDDIEQKQSQSLHQESKVAFETFLQSEVYRNGQSHSKLSNPERAQYLVENNEPPSPPQPANLLHTSVNSQGHPKGSIIEKLFKAAHIRAMIEKGDVEESFNEALGCHDLSLVEGACRAADPQRVFAAPCCLRQPTLLSLVQQLSTDVTQDTNLKCQYIEECIINLDKTHPATRANLPLIVGEVRKHLSNFLLSNPGHPLSRRITLILMAADNLLL